MDPSPEPPIRRRDAAAPVSQGDELELDIDQLADGPDALARIDGYVVLLAGALPGERVLARITSANRKHGRARLVRVLRPAPERVAARCSHFLDCGGCSLQHLQHAAQLRSKEERLRKALRHALHELAPEVHPTLAPADAWQQRHKVVLHLRGSGRSLQGGFHPARSAGLVTVRECPVSHPDAFAIAQRAVTALRPLDLAAQEPHRPTGVLRAVLVRFAAATREAHLVVIATAPIPRLLDRAAGLLQTGATSVALNVNDGPLSRLLGRQTHSLAGPPRIREEIDGCTHLLSADAFFQTSPAGAATLVRAVRSALEPDAGDRLLDLYCGGGLFALPLARVTREVVGVEESPVAVGDAVATARAQRLTNVRFERAAVSDWLQRTPAWQPTKAVLDPPRTGAGPEVVRSLCRQRPSRVAYVSCDADSLAADLHGFTASGYRAAAVQPVDMFPHTHHVEAVVTLLPTAPPRGRRGAAGKP